MYCKKCGKELQDNAKFCDSCGTATDSVYTPPTSQPAQVPLDNTAVFITLITAIITLISPFLNMFYINVFEEKNFSPIHMVKILKEVTEYYSQYSIYDFFESSLTIVTYICFFAFIIFILFSIISFIASLGQIFAGDKKSEYNYFRNISVSTSFGFAANLELFMGLLFANWVITDTLDSDEFIWIFGANILFVIIMIVGLVGSSIASNKVRLYKKN